MHANQPYAIASSSGTRAAFAALLGAPPADIAFPSIRNLTRKVDAALKKEEEAEAACVGHILANTPTSSLSITHDL